MRKLVIIIAALMAWPSAAFAQAVQAKHQTNHPTATIAFLAATPINGGSIPFTITNPNGGFAFANLEVIRVRNAGTDLAMTCKSTTDTGAAAAQRTVCSYDATGVCTSATATLKSTTSSTETLAWVVNILGWRTTTCTFTSTSSNASDTVAVNGGMVTQ